MVRPNPNPPGFLQWVSPKLKVPHSVIIGNHDAELGPAVLQFLENPLLLHVFAINTSPEIARHPKITAIPIGMSHFGFSHRPIQQIVAARQYKNPFGDPRSRHCWGTLPSTELTARSPAPSYRDLHEAELRASHTTIWAHAGEVNSWDLTDDHQVLRDAMSMHTKLPKWIKRDPKRGGAHGSNGRAQRAAAKVMVCDLVRNNSCPGTWGLHAADAAVWLCMCMSRHRFPPLPSPSSRR